MNSKLKIKSYPENSKLFRKNRKNEVISFLNLGLEDISISRSNQRAKNWGVPVPHDDTQKCMCGLTHLIFINLVLALGGTKLCTINGGPLMFMS